jgi:hypothetical protein
MKFREGVRERERERERERKKERERENRQNSKSGYLNLSVLTHSPNSNE